MDKKKKIVKKKIKISDELKNFLEKLVETKIQSNNKEQQERTRNSNKKKVDNMIDFMEKVKIKIKKTNKKN